jgi:dipeptidyl aminopeptidase/acylaminoacyl peptidase
LKNGVLRELVDSPGVNHAPQLSPDGTRLVYRSDRTGAAELWMSRLDATNDVRLTSFNGPMVGSPRWSPDGSAILFECRPKGQSQICVVHPDGKGDTRVLTHWSANQTYPSWSHDGSSFYFTSNDSGRWEIYRQPFGGVPEQLTHSGGQRALESPTGAWLYISKGEPQGGIERVALPGAKETPQPVKTDLGPWGAGVWDVSNDGVIYLSGTSVRNVNGETGRTQQLETLKQAPPVGDLVFSYAASTGEILFVQGERHDGEINMLQRRVQ